MAHTNKVEAKATTYTFQQPPKSVGSLAGTALNYRDPFANKSAKSNIMYDRRVHRGNTYAAQVLPLSAQVELQRAEKEAEEQRKKILREQKHNSQKSISESNRATTPKAVEGRQHIDIQTEQFLEELKDKPDEVTQESQTDPMLDRPPTPKYIPFKTGCDAETQIKDGDLFDFDNEVDPILDVMVGKTLEQAMLEVMQEEEIDEMRRQQEEFERKRNDEILEMQRLEEEEKRKFTEKENRKKQEVQRNLREQKTKEKITARMFSKSFLTNLENRVFARLEDEGWFHDAVEREVELDFMPWLMEQVDKDLDKHRKAQLIVDELIRLSLQ